MHGKRSVRWTSLMILVFAILCLSGCETTPGRDFNLLSTRDEVAMGREFAAEVERQEKLLDDPAIQSYVAQMGARLAAVSPRQNITYSVRVIDAPDTINAFALPGGFIYVYTGLMRICSNEAELAAVIAHEIGHVAAYHHGETFTRMMGLQLGTALVLGSDPTQTTRILDDLFVQGIAARYSREQERQADALGMEILFRAGYRPDAMIDFMYKQMEYNRGRVHLPIFASHPPTEERVARLQNFVSQYPAETRHSQPLYTERYETEVLRKLRWR